MSEKLILRMSSQTTSAIPWLVYSDTNNEVIASGELAHQGELSDLAQYAQGRQVTVLANSADVRLHRHYMATKPSRQIIKALPYMLEDELAADIDALHIATEESGYDKTTEQYWLNIAIVNKALVHDWLETLSEAGLVVKRILPESLCLPIAPATEHAQLSALQVADGWLFREDNWQGTFVESSWLPIYVGKLLATMASKDSTDDGQTLLTVQPYSQLPEDTFSRLEEQANIKVATTEPELAMLVLAKGADQTKWNLLQGELAPKKAVSKNWQIWRTAAVIACFILVLELVAKGVAWQKAESELAAKKAELVEMYQQAFPKEKVRVALLRRQLTRKVAEAGGGETQVDTGYLTLMLKLTPVLKQHSGVISDSFRYDASRGELRISASAPSFQKFEQFRIALEQLGLDVKQGAVSNEGETVSGTINVKEVG